MMVLLTLSLWPLMSCQTCRMMMRGLVTMSEHGGTGIDSVSHQLQFISIATS